MKTLFLNKKYSILFSTLFLSACFLTPQQASKLTPLDLCERYYFGVGAERVKEVIYQEVMNRGIDCNQYKDILIARQNARNADSSAFVQGVIGTSILINATTPQSVQNNTVIIKEQTLPPVNIQKPNTIR